MQKNIAVVAGGYSGEYEISIKSAQTVCAHLPQEKYKAYLIEMTKGECNWINGDQKIPVNLHDFSVMDDGNIVTFDCAFIAIHGTPGEDGKLQGYFDIIGLPYTTGDTDTMATTFNKATCLAVLKKMGLNVAKGIVLQHTENGVAADKINQTIGFPCFVKPANGGSSLGASKVDKMDDVPSALNKAFREDTEVMVEEYIQGVELTCGVANISGNAMAFPVTEIVTENDFFDFEAKYVGSKTQEITPARIPEGQQAECQEIALRIYNELNCKGLVRIDFFLVGTQFYVIEVNTVPGMTEMSFFPQQAKAAGIPLDKLFSSAIEDVLGS